MSESSSREVSFSSLGANRELSGFNICVCAYVMVEISKKKKKKLILQGFPGTLGWLSYNKTSNYSALWRCKSHWDAEVERRAQHSWEPWWQSVGLHSVTFEWSISQSVTCDTAGHLSNYDRCLLTHVRTRKYTCRCRQTQLSWTGRLIWQT